MKNTNNNLVLKLVQAITPILQEYLEANNTEVKEEPAAKIYNQRFELTFDRIGKHTRLDPQKMRQIVDLKMKRNKQKTIAKILKTSQPSVSNYLKVFQKHYKKAEESVQTKMNVA
jgi:ribosomal protein S8